VEIKAGQVFEELTNGTVFVVKKVLAPVNGNPIIAVDTFGQRRNIEYIKKECRLVSEKAMFPEEAPSSFKIKVGQTFEELLTGKVFTVQEILTSIDGSRAVAIGANGERYDTSFIKRQCRLIGVKEETPLPSSIKAYIIENHTVTHFSQQDPWTFIEIMVTYEGHEYSGVGFARRVYKDKWIAELGRDIALGRAIKDVIRNIANNDWAIPF